MDLVLLFLKNKLSTIFDQRRKENINNHTTRNLTETKIIWLHILHSIKLHQNIYKQNIIWWDIWNHDFDPLFVSIKSVNLETF